MTKDQILQTVRTLPKEDQLDLALELWESIDAGSAVLQLTEVQKQELDRGIAADAANPPSAEAWEDLKAKLLEGDF